VARVLRCEVTVLRKQRRRLRVEHGEPRVALARLDARGPQQHARLSLVNAVGTLDLHLGHEERDAIGLRDRGH